jgi:transposase
MPKAYSADMRERVIAEVEGGASRREAAEEFEVSASTAIIWVKCFRETGRCAAKARGGSISPLDKHADFLLGLIEKQSDLTLDEVVLLMRKHKIPGSRTAVWRFFQRHNITFKKKACARRSKSARMWRGHAGAGCENRACLILRTLCSSTKPPPIPRWCG